MNQRLFTYLILAFIPALTDLVQGQNVTNYGKPVLFTIDDSPVYSDEFKYIYQKNNSNNENAFTKEDIDEYLDLFINFKLKVTEARNLGYDTTHAYKEELSRFHDQLMKPYLTESEVTDALVEEAYERMKYEVDVSHILISVRPGAAPQDTLEAFNKIKEIRKKAINGYDFSELALKYSEEPSIELTRGHLGYFTALQMVYPFETMAYSTPIGGISQPFRTQFGYHILKVHDKRPNRGKVHVSHIMLRLNPSMSREDSIKIRDRIFEIYEKAISGYDWDQLCKENSQDLNSRDRGGTLSPFGVGEMVPEIVEASFALEEVGDISDPVMTPYGWHILILNGKTPLPSFKDYEAQLSRRIQRDSRSNKSHEALITRLKRENRFKESTEVKNDIFDQVDSATFSGSWNPNVNAHKVIFSLSDSVYTIGDFIHFVNNNFQKAETGHNSIRIDRLYNAFIEVKLIEYEKLHLEDKYEDYRHLMKEYREGILLFEIMEKEVWAKSGTDSTGIKEFYNNNLSNYKVEESAGIITFEVLKEEETKALTDTLSILAEDTTLSLESVKEVVDREFPDVIIKKSGIYNQRDPGWIEQASRGNGVYKSVLPEGSEITLIMDYKSDTTPGIDEIRGIVISDYQDYLDKKWIEELKNKYEVKIDKRELKKLYKSLVQ